jgi:hypothetical protein
MKILIFLLSLLQVSNAFAQGGGHAGNGGGNEILFHNLSEKISEWLTKNLANSELEKKLHLNGMSVTGESLVKAYQSAVADTPDVKFIPASKLAEECSKQDLGACIIRCNSDLFDEAKGKIQFAIVFHEYLGVAGIESNGTSDLSSYSRYPISQYILNFVAARLRVFTDYELVSDAPPVLAEQPILSEREFLMRNPSVSYLKMLSSNSNFSTYSDDDSIQNRSNRDFSKIDEINLGYSAHPRALEDGRNTVLHVRSNCALDLEKRAITGWFGYRTTVWVSIPRRVRSYLNPSNVSIPVSRVLGLGCLFVKKLSSAMAGGSGSRRSLASVHVFISLSQNYRLHRTSC